MHFHPMQCLPGPCSVLLTGELHNLSSYFFGAIFSKKTMIDFLGILYFLVENPGIYFLLSYISI